MGLQCTCSCVSVLASRHQAPGLLVQVVLLRVAIVVRHYVRALRRQNNLW